MAELQTQFRIILIKTYFINDSIELTLPHDEELRV